jgi:hypothetical protein
MLAGPGQGRRQSGARDATKEVLADVSTPSRGFPTPADNPANVTNGSDSEQVGVWRNLDVMS